MALALSSPNRIGVVETCNTDNQMALNSVHLHKSTPFGHSAVSLSVADYVGTIPAERRRSLSVLAKKMMKCGVAELVVVDIYCKIP